jgi:hypothetical protein
MLCVAVRQVGCSREFEVQDTPVAVRGRVRTIATVSHERTDEKYVATTREDRSRLHLAES